MKLVLKLLLLLLFVTGCKTKHLQIEKNEERQKEVRKSEKDSIYEVKNEVKTAVFQVDNSKSVELELITDKDSVGNSKELHFTRYRDGPKETITVRGGSLRLKTTQHTANKLKKKDTLQVNNTSVRTNILEDKTTEKQIFKKEKEVKSTGFSFGFYFWIIIILVILFLIWRLKLFRLFSVILVKIKKCLNNI